MKRVLAVLAGASFVLAIGCSDYDIRLEKTLEEKKYEKRLNTNLEAAPTKGKLQGDEIFVRPPLGLQIAQAFVLPAAETQKFDIENSFIDQKKGTSLHVVREPRSPRARPAPRRGRRPPSNPPPSGANSSTTLSSWSRPPIASSCAAGLKSESKKHGNRANDYKAVKLDLTTKVVEVYVFTESNGIHDVAMIFEYPTAEKTYMEPKSVLLESFAVGDRARRFFDGATATDVDGGGGEMASPAQDRRSRRTTESPRL